MKIALATTNIGKIKEFKELLTPLNFSIITKQEAGITQEFKETGNSFTENAEIKAKALFQLLHMPTIADDSGLEVDALNGRPGIYSARYSKEGTDYANNQKLLKEMENIKDRRARFVCAICFINSKGKVFNILKTVQGEIARNIKGTGGFGYDPLFLYNGVRFSDIKIDAKNKVSHRGKCIKDLILNIKNWI